MTSISVIASQAALRICSSASRAPLASPVETGLHGCGRGLYCKNLLFDGIVHIVFRAYAVIFGLLGLMLLLWGPMWFGRNVAGVPFDGATLVRVFGSMFVTAACCAAVLSAMGDTLVRSRSLFWFAMGHAVVWLVALAEL